jgi:hypothetical protein
VDVSESKVTPNLKPQASSIAIKWRPEEDEFLIKSIDYLIKISNKKVGDTIIGLEVSADSHH